MMNGSGAHINGQSRSQATPTPASASDLLPKAPHYREKGSIPNTPLAVSVISALLGGVALSSLTLAAQHLLGGSGLGGNWARPQLGIYGFAWGLFHLCEFWTTAGWNPLKLSVDAFLLNNTNQYHYAHLFGLGEYFLSSYFFPGKFDSRFCSAPVILAVCALLVGGQALRSLAMIHANASFSHVVKDIKHDDHVLITHGVYSLSRHPSYCGFFYWAIATQLLLGNIISTLVFIFILGRFFSSRIREEEKYLVRFFGDDYVQYRRRVGTGLPFLISP
ncbi:protein-S-isoprenylcysteine O-methyltransferase [Kockovaella imperatae]|uniref:Protein-S-isoprenylcysteine O-methyltransferase n=1 Tax=Kockovaella imperatae TaxID=4999 RepID=A0A1Y1U6G8_9TREE|nr:protein-S-isoprenylcysteine O-methyltransferase [Kockovaella imperatae]ORX33630.1 protein-S-isoprenylcysteine O-methyltransferase [Kockovaella imperatae]